MEDQVQTGFEVHEKGRTEARAVSVWEEGRRPSPFPGLRGSVKTDVLIIGGGLCGILCAYFLKQAGVDCLLAEADRIGGGVTGNTTAKLTSQHGLIYDKLRRSFGRETAAAYLRANETALEQYRRLAQDIDCDFERKDAFIYSLRDRDKLEREVQAVNDLGFPAAFCQSVPLPFETAGAVRFPGQAQFHPLKFLTGIAAGLPVFEQTKIEQLAPHRAWNQEMEITADRIIVATHYPFLNKHGGYFLKLYQSRSYVLALKGAREVDGMYMDENTGGLSFRNYRDMLLVGGGSHRTGKRGKAHCCLQGGWQELRNFAASCYPHAQEVYAWATQDCMSLDRMPYIGLYSQGTPGLYAASGFNKWGMTSSMLAAMLLTDRILDRANPWAEIFSPDRSVWKPQLLLNGAETLKGLLTPASRRCPHLGCALKWNKEEHSWDCPCHGSRFEEDGTLLDNPATADAGFRKTKAPRQG